MGIVTKSKAEFETVKQNFDHEGTVGLYAFYRHKRANFLVFVSPHADTVTTHPQCQTLPGSESDMYYYDNDFKGDKPEIVNPFGQRLKEA